MPVQELPEDQRICRNFTDPTAPPGCLKVYDPKFTMRFDDLGERPIYWCSFCGPMAAAMDELLQAGLQARGPEFKKDLEKAITEAERDPSLSALDRG